MKNKKGLSLLSTLCIMFMSWSFTSCSYIGTKGLKFNDSGDGYYVSGYTGSDTTVKIPSKYKNKPVLRIGTDAFMGSFIEKVILPDSITDIYPNAFYNCSSLKEVVFGKNVESIFSSAFGLCVSLEEITLPDSVIRIKSGGFAGCSSLVNINLSKNIERLETRVFYGCTSLQYTLYDNAKYLGNQENKHLALMGAINNDIGACDIHEDTKIIASDAFSYTNIKSITIPKNVRVIEECAFNDCLETINILDREYLSVFKNSFTYNGVLKYKEYENGLYLGNEDNPYLVFVKPKTKENNTELIDIKINEKTKIIAGNAFNGYSGSDAPYSYITKIDLPEGLIHIGEGAFSGCINLKLVIPSSVKYVGESSLPKRSTIYCCVKENLEGYKDKRFTQGNQPKHSGVYWLGEWDYDENGTPYSII